MRVHQPDDPVGVVRYLLADHLGSSTQIIDSDGTLQESVKYYPYGSAREGRMNGTDKLFTGQQEEGSDFGLYNYGARFYSAKLGRFLSADPLVAGAGGLTVNLALLHTPSAGRVSNPQALDRYSYVLSNPLRYTDPTGLSNTVSRTFYRNPQGPVDWEGLKKAGDQLVSSGVPAELVAPTLLTLAYWANSPLNSLPPGALPTPTATPVPFSDPLFGITSVLEGGLGAGGQFAVGIFWQDGKPRVIISLAGGGYAGVGGGWAPINVVLGGITPGASLEGPFADTGIMAGPIGLDYLVNKTTQALGVGAFAGGGLAFSGMAGYQWDITEEIGDFLDVVTFW